MSLENKLIVKKGIDLYNESIRNAANEFEKVKWNNPEKLFYRFHNILKNKNQQISILDIGCGNGLLVHFMNNIGFRCSYYEGWDINDTLLQEAKEKYPNLIFENVDIQSNCAIMNKKFDLVVICGLFNCNMGQNEDWCFEFINKAFSFVNETGVLSFNAVSTYVNSKQEGMFYLDPAQTMHYCVSNLSKRIDIAHHDLPYNYTVNIYKKADFVVLK